MSRVYQSLQTLLGSARIASRLPSGQTVRVERVRIKKGKPTTRFLGTVIKGALLFQLAMWAIPPPRTRKDDHDGTNGTGGDQEESQPRFIPLPLTTVRHPPQPYSANDPEWREFVRISKDKEFQKQMRQYMAGIVLKAVTSNPIIAMKYGQDAKITRYWMDIDYPYRAPPTYERSGILITDQEIALASMECDPWTAKFLSHVLWPRPVALGFWAFGTAIVKQQAQQVARYFGFGSVDSDSPQARPNPGTPPALPSAPGPDVQRALERIRQGTTKRPEEVNDPGSMSPSGSAAPGPHPFPPGKPYGAPNKTAVVHNSESGREDLKRDPENLKLPLTDSMSQPLRKLKEAYVKERNALRPDPVRGSIFISGLVEVQTSKAWIVIDVFGWYDPKTKAHCPGAVRMAVRRMQNRVQAPAQR